MNQIKFNGDTVTPSKVVCIGRNYLAHIQELGNQVPDDLVVFIKPNSAISLELNTEHLSQNLHYEAELAYLYQQGTFTAVALGLDLTKRTLQSSLKSQGLPWEKAKAFNGSALFTDFVDIKEIDEPLTLSLSINKQIVQQASNELMMHKPSEILAQLETWLTLEDGDIIMTGTPKGVGEVTVESEFIGQVLRENNVIVEGSWLTDKK